MTANLHLLCGKIAAGKSTLARRLAEAPATLLVSQDDWLPRLYPGEIATLEDYVRCSGRLREAMAPHLAAILKAGLSIVLDFPANTVATRAWMREMFEAAGADHRLHLLEAPDALCKSRLAERNAAGEHPYRSSEEIFEIFTRHFVPPSADEGFEVVLHRQG